MATEDDLDPQLQRLGLTAVEARVYRYLLQHGPAHSDDIAAALIPTGPTGPTDLITVAVGRLVTVGLVGPVGEHGAVVPIAPLTGLDLLTREREAELREAQVAAGRAYDTFRRTVWQPSEGLIEIVTGVDIPARIEQVEANAAREILRFDSPPYSTTALPNEIEYANLARGVTYRVVYARAAIEVPGYYEENVRPSVAAGEQARVLPSVPVKLSIVDQRLGLVSWPIQQAEVNNTLVIVQPSALLSALTGLFEMGWRAALPMHVGDDGPSGLRPVERQVLELLAMGLTDEVIAERIGVSRRTLTRHVERLMDRAGVDGRFQLGMAAARHGWL
ncbi:MAG: helix-turn-helix transcriptional regulator [Jatrophihabitans sp.]|uniref:helix-turn-helix transcriptional regulator n=1 Tax=Jatrophihabitans sp. TaxID=1932789 RepID=UPI003F7DE723